MPERAWDQMKQLNKLLIQLRISTIEQSQLSKILESTVEVSVRKLRGQYPTPLTLAKLLVELCIDNIQDDKILDPCCGSGTIPRAALEQKLSIGCSPEDATSMVFAGDQDHQAIQIATFAMTKPNLMNIPLRIFQHDAFFLKTNTELKFRDPKTGVLFTEEPGQFNVIASNLPFVGQKGRTQYEDAIKLVNASFRNNPSRLPRTTDISAYFPFALYPLLIDGGRLGIIITNAWLSTEWGEKFFNLLQDHYHLQYVITSGAGRWFNNSKVVTNLLIMEKVTNQKDVNRITDFITLTRPLEELSDSETLKITASQIRLSTCLADTMTIRSISYEQIQRFRMYGLGGNAQFVNCDWGIKPSFKTHI